MWSYTSDRRPDREPDASRIRKVVVEDGVEGISAWTFSQRGSTETCCENLTSVSIPASVSSIEENFNRCPKLARITVASGNEHYVVRDNALYTKDYSRLLRVIPERRRTDAFPNKHPILSFRQTAAPTGSSPAGAVLSFGGAPFDGCVFRIQ